MSRFDKPPKRIGILGLIRRWITDDEGFFLKCDAKGCIYTVFYEYPHLSLIDTPCPMCGANLCTESDMRAFVTKADPT